MCTVSIPNIGGGSKLKSAIPATFGKRKLVKLIDTFRSPWCRMSSDTDLGEEKVSCYLLGWGQTDSTSYCPPLLLPPSPLVRSLPDLGHVTHASPPHPILHLTHFTGIFPLQKQVPTLAELFPPTYILNMIRGKLNKYFLLTYFSRFKENLFGISAESRGEQ